MVAAAVGKLAAVVFLCLDKKAPRREGPRLLFET